MKNLRNQIVFIVAVLVVWQVVYQMGSFPELMFPSLGKIFQSLIKGFSRDGLGAMTLYSLSLIAKGLLIGIVLAFIAYIVARCGVDPQRVRQHKE